MHKGNGKWGSGVDNLAACEGIRVGSLSSIEWITGANLVRGAEAFRHSVVDAMLELLEE